MPSKSLSKAIKTSLDSLFDALSAWDAYFYTARNTSVDYTLTHSRTKPGCIIYHTNSASPRPLSSHDILKGQHLRDTVDQTFGVFIDIIDTFPSLNTHNLDLTITHRYTIKNGKPKYNLAVEHEWVTMHAAMDSTGIARSLAQLHKNLSLYDWSGTPQLWMTKRMHNLDNPNLSYAISAPDVCLAAIKYALLKNPKPTYVDLITLHNTPLYKVGETQPTLPNGKRLLDLLDCLEIPIPQDGRYVCPYLHTVLAP